MEYGSQHGITGDEYGVELPQTQVEEQDLAIEKNAAKFSKSKEYQALKSHLEQRINHYQTQLPSGKPITEASLEDWKVASLLIAELQAILDFYENARISVQDAQRA